MTDPPSPTLTSSTSSEDTKDKENNDRQGEYGTTSSKRNRYKKRFSRKKEEEVHVKGSDLNLKGYYYQCYGEPGHKSNQFSRTTNKIQEEFNREHKAAHLMEPLFRGEDINLVEPEELDKTASRGTFIR